MAIIRLLSRIMARRSWFLADALLLLVFAAALRLPYLHSVPRYTDEVKEVMWALRIYWGEHLPLAAHNGYSGPIWNYLLAGLFAVFGPAPGMPRATMFVIGCATVVATYALGRAMGGRTAGWLAGLLMATSYVPIFLNSHVAWSACAVPLLTTGALLASVEARRRSSGMLLVIAGLLVGLAMQAHPVGILVVPGLVLWMASSADGRRLIRSRWTLAAGAAALLAYANMLAFHAVSRLETVTTALDKLSDGVPGERSPRAYAFALEAALANLVDMLGARGHVALAPYVFDVRVAVWVGGLAILGLLLYAARRGASLPLIVTATVVVLVPLFNTAYSFPLGARYLSFLLPVVYAAAGVAGAGLVASWGRRSAVGRGLAAGLVVAAVLAVSTLHIGSLARTYREEAAVGRTNDLVHEILTVARTESASSGAVVLWSDRIDAKFSGGGHLHRVFAVLLGLAEVPNERIQDDLDGLETQLSRCRPDCLLILAGHHQTEVALRAPIVRVPLTHAPLDEDGEPYGLYRLGTR